MAFSQPTEKAQTPTVCQFCEKPSDIRWKCINCDVSMCQLCITKIHKKIKSSDQHYLIDLKDYGSENVARTIRKMDLQKMTCISHSDQTCCAFCTDCDQPICIDCLIQFHKKHKYRKLNEVYESTISEIKDFQIKLESFLQYFGNEKERLINLLLDCDKNFQGIKDRILLTEKEMIVSISKYTKEIIQELESIWKPTENRIKSELSDIQKNTEELINREESLKKTMLSHQALDIFSSRKLLDGKLPTTKVEIVTCDILKTKFLPGNIFEKKNIRRTIFGELYTDPNLELVRTYQSDFPNVLDILNCDSNTAFISCFERKLLRLDSDTYFPIYSNEQKLQKVKFKEKHIKVEEDFIKYVRSMAKLNNGEILMSTGESEVKVYSTDVKQFRSFKSFSPLKSISVHVSKDDKIFVGLTECFPVTYAATEDMVRRVVVLTQDGEMKHFYEFNKDKQRLFTEPLRIITMNDNIYIIDSINYMLEGRVMGLDYGGKLLWTYNGCGINSKSALFYPSDLTATSTEMILISDQLNHAIHVLNFAGEVVVFKEVKTLGIELPLSLSFDNNDILWIGCNTWDVDESKKAKIFAVKLV